MSVSQRAVRHPRTYDFFTGNPASYWHHPAPHLTLPTFIFDITRTYIGADRSTEIESRDTVAIEIIRFSITRNQTDNLVDDETQLLILLSRKI